MQFLLRIMLIWQPTELDSTWNLISLRMQYQIACARQMNHASGPCQHWMRRWRMWCSTVREKENRHWEGTKEEMQRHICTWVLCLYVSGEPPIFLKASLSNKFCHSVEYVMEGFWNLVYLILWRRFFVSIKSTSQANSYKWYSLRWYHFQAEATCWSCSLLWFGT